MTEDQGNVAKGIFGAIIDIIVVLTGGKSKDKK